MLGTAKYLFIGTIVASAVILSFSDAATAASKTKKLTFEQAWKLCKQKLDKEGAMSTSTSANDRFIKGGGCMKEHGYSL
jgi:hypothetical protein